jgi:hypothetical protein
VGQRDEPAAVSEFAIQCIEIKSTVHRDWQKSQNDAFPFRDLLPGHQIAVVVKNR